MHLYILSKFSPNVPLYHFLKQIKNQKIEIKILKTLITFLRQNMCLSVQNWKVKHVSQVLLMRQTSKEWITCTSTILKQQNIFHLIVKLVHWAHCKIIGWSTKVVIVLVKYMPVVRGKFPTVLTVAVFGRRNNVHWAWCWWHPWLIWRGVWGLLMHSPFYSGFRHKNIQQGVITSTQIFKLSRKLDFSVKK